jgi:hypothetical protein
MARLFLIGHRDVIARNFGICSACLRDQRPCPTRPTNHPLPANASAKARDANGKKVSHLYIGVRLLIHLWVT